MPAETTVLSAVSSALVTTIKITEKLFEIIAVDEQSNNLLATINQVNEQLEIARTLRRQKSDLFSEAEKTRLKRTFENTDKALDHVARLVERARVDQKIYGPGKVRLQNRILFVLRDSPHIMTDLTQLGIVSQHLNTAIVMLDFRQPPPRVIITQEGIDLSNGSAMGRRPPPSYDDSQMVASVRQKTLRKRASALSATNSTGAWDIGPQQLHRSSSTLRDLYVAAADSVDETTEAEIGIEFGCPSRPEDLTPSSSLGKARSRRWLESHCR